MLLVCVIGGLIGFSCGRILASVDEPCAVAYIHIIEAFVVDPFAGAHELFDVIVDLEERDQERRDDYNSC